MALYFMTYAYTPRRSTDRKWMWSMFGVAGLFAFGAFMAWAHLAYEVTISCERASDACEAVKHKNLGSSVTPFRLSEVKGVFLATRTDKRGRPSTECITINRTRGQPLTFCNPSDDEIIDGFNAFLKDPTAARFDGEIERALFGHLVAWVAALIALVPFVFGMILLTRLRRGTGYPPLHGESP